MKKLCSLIGWAGWLHWGCRNETDKLKMALATFCLIVVLFLQNGQPPWVLYGLNFLVELIEKFIVRCSMEKSQQGQFNYSPELRNFVEHKNIYISWNSRKCKKITKNILI